MTPADALAEEIFLKPGFPMYDSVSRNPYHMENSVKPGEIRKMRKSWGMTQAELAREMGVARETVSRWENGREAPIPSLVRILRHVARSGSAS